MRRSAFVLCLLLSCAHTPQAALDAEKVSPTRARDFCISKHTGALTAAASCADLCVEDGLTNYCARKNPRPEWPPKGLTPIVEEDT